MPIEVLHNQTEIKQEIFETEQEIANKILFTSAPKIHGRNSIKENYPYPYYDSTYLSKVNQISNLKNKVEFLKTQINSEEELDQNNLKNNTLINKMNLRLNNENTNIDDNEPYNYEKNIINSIDNHNRKNKNNGLHLFIIINNDTYPHSLSEMEDKLNMNSRNFSESKITHDDLLKEQIASIDSLYEKRKSQLTDFNNEMKRSITDIHDKKYIHYLLI